MKTVEKFLNEIPDEILFTKVFDEHQQIESITIDSREARTNTCFVAIKGLATDGHQYIDKAIEAGATTIICQDEISHRAAINYIRVRDSRRAASLLAACFYDYPSHTMPVIGVTGTNGKTSVVSMLYDVFEKLGYRVAKLTTIENIVAGEVLEATHTTPGPVKLQNLLAKCVQTKCDYCFMEVSSHALDQERASGVTFKGGVFTNLTHDHLDYHKTFKDYLNAKKKFFDNLPTSAFALTNLDDKNGIVMVQNCKAAVKGYALRKLTDYKTKILEQGFGGLHLKLNNKEVLVPLFGQFNAYNLTAVFGAALELGQDPNEVLVAISTLRPPAGRFDVINAQEIMGIVDYAHTPDALENVLKTIIGLKMPTSRIITVVGCGGNRDKTKRPKMSLIATTFSQHVIITSDNPRNEKPTSIMADMMVGLDNQQKEKTFQIENRREAIRLAVQLARSRDIILVAGKGHEAYQEIEGVKYPFDDKAILFDALTNKTGF